MRALDLHTAGRAESRLAVGGTGQRLARLLLGFGSVAFVAGAAILLVSLGPMFVGGSDSSTLTAQLAGPLTQLGDSATVVAPTPSGTTVAPTPAAGRPAPSGGPIDGVSFEMIVPAVGYRAMVRDGVTKSVLDQGPGHYPGTPWPGRGGNVGVAGHNTFWLSFNRLRIGDRVEIRTQHGFFVYVITGSKVVDPNDRAVLSVTDERRLTLTTCYPLWAGVFATKRLIFTAREIGGVT